MGTTFIKANITNITNCQKLSHEVCNFELGTTAEMEDWGSLESEMLLFF